MARVLLSAYACEPGKGSEPQVGWLWATELADAGHDVWVITRSSNRKAIERETSAKARSRLHFTYCELPGWVRWWKRGGWSVYWYYALWQWVALRRARALHRRVGFDWVQHVTFVGLRAPSWMGWLGIPFVMGPVSGGEVVPHELRRGISWRARAVEGLRDAGNALLRWEPLMRANLRRASVILAATEATRNILPRELRERCRVQLGVGLSREFLAWTGPAPAVPGEAFRLLYAGRLVEWKGVELALRAVRAVRDTGANVRFTVVGSGPAEKRLRRVANELRLEDAVDWRRWMPQAELLAQYQQHDALLFPSLRDSGGMVVLEALAHGLPVVCTDLGGPGTIVNERCGRVVAAKGQSRESVVAGLAAAVCELQRNRYRLAQLRRGARTRAWQFDFHKTVLAVCDAMEPILQQAARCDGGRPVMVSGRSDFRCGGDEPEPSHPASIASLLPPRHESVVPTHL